MTKERLNHGASTIVLLLMGYCLLFATLPAAPLLDFPNHLTRAWLISQSLQGHNALFEFTPQFMPYILGDLLLAILLTVVPWRAADILWMCVCYLSLPLGVLAFCRSREELWRQTVLVISFCSYAAANWFFLSGFANYCLSLGFVFLAAAAWERMCRKQCRIGFLTWWFVYLGFVAICYGLHLSAFLFGGIIIGATFVFRAFRGSLSCLRVFVSSLPFIFLTLYYSMSQMEHSAHAAPWVYRNVLEKILAIGSMYVRYNFSVDVLLTMIILLVLPVFFLLSVRVARPEIGEKSKEYAFVFVLLTACYVLLPVRAEPAYGVDSRALPYISVFGVLFFGNLLLSSERMHYHATQFIAATSFVSLLYLIPHVRAHASFVRLIDDAWARIPPGQSVLSVATRPDTGRVQPSLHRAELYMIEKGGHVPYVFSRNTSGAQLEYFSYRNYPYAPDIHWYLKGMEVSWRLVAANYSYIIITQPFDGSRLSNLSLEPFYENKAAVVFKTVSPIDRS